MSAFPCESYSIVFSMAEQLVVAVLENRPTSLAQMYSTSHVL